MQVSVAGHVPKRSNNHKMAKTGTPGMLMRWVPVAMETEHAGKSPCRKHTATPFKKDLFLGAGRTRENIEKRAYAFIDICMMSSHFR